MKLKHLSMLSLIALGVFATTSCGLKKESSNVSTTNPSTSIPSTSIPATSTPTPTTPTPTTPTNPSTTPTYEGYYSSITTNILSNSSSLKSTLNQIVSANTKKISYSDATTSLKTIDSYDGDYVECIYTGERLGKDNSGSASGQWNKEHIWAKSHGFNDQKYDAYSDLHHLRVSEARINSSRSNSYFDEVSNPTNKDDYGNKWTSTVFEPRDEVKGDIARMLLYMVVRYEDSTLDLELTNDTTLASKAENGTEGYIGILNTILKWNFEDPVDSRELYRNEEIYKEQGNRNPFIDHPELAYYLYKTECESKSITESYSLSHITPVLKNDSKIEEVNAKIKQIGTVTLESKTKIESAEALYNSLDDISKSFVTEYDVLNQARFDYNVLYSKANQDTSISTTMDLTILSDTSGSLALNGIELSYTAPYVYNKKGIYAQMGGKDITLKISNLYEAITNIELTFTSNKPDSKKPAGTAAITISDGTNTTSYTTEILDKSSSHLARIDVSELDMSKELTITISSNFSSAILEQIKFSVI